jgi:hypothetical protein
MVASGAIASLRSGNDLLVRALECGLCLFLRARGQPHGFCRRGDLAGSSRLHDLVETNLADEAGRSEDAESDQRCPRLALVAVLEEGIMQGQQERLGSVEDPK